ncbi:Hypothetical protein SCF082_LOCUS1708, partial [Durusdinium trenchii]
ARKSAVSFAASEPGEEENDPQRSSSGTSPSQMVGIPGEVVSEADESAMLARAARSKSCLKSDFDSNGRSESRKSRTDSRGVVIDRQSRMHKVLFVDDVHQDAPIEEVKEVAPVKNKGSDCGCTIV